MITMIKTALKRKTRTLETAIMTLPLEITRLLQKIEASQNEVPAVRDKQKLNDIAVKRLNWPYSLEDQRSKSLQNLEHPQNQILFT